MGAVKQAAAFSRKNDSRKMRPREELYIALSELDFSWYPGEVEQVAQLWREGIHIADIAEKIKRDIDEVAILIMDLARRDVIEPRKNGVAGEAT
jgi:hypothetical protein